MSPRFAELTAQAQALTSAGDLAGARAVLADALAPTDADPQHASPALAAAAALNARILVTLGDPMAARDWAGFAHTAQRRLYGPDDQRTLAATATHAAVLHRVGNHALAAQLYRDVVEQLLASDGPDSLRVLAAQADLATAEHAAGDCTDAQARLADAWQRHRRRHGDAAPAGIKMLARLGAMERDCGQLVESREHLALAGEFCARYLPGDHGLARQIAALARAPVSGRHRCDPDPPGGDGFPPESPPAAAPRNAAPPNAAPPNAAPPNAAAPNAAAPNAAWDAARVAPGVTPLPRTGPPGASAPPTDPRPGYPDRGYPDRGFADRGFADRGYSDPGYPERGYPDRDFPEPDYARAAAGDWPGAGVGAGRAAIGPGYDPDPDDPRLPVPVSRPARSRRPLAVAAVTAGVLIAAAAVAAMLPITDAAPPVAAPSAAAPPEVVPSSATRTTGGGTARATGAVRSPAGTAESARTSRLLPPTGVTLRDARDSVTLQWTYPAGAEGPVLISGGRTGQQRRAFQQLPAGSVDYVVYGLNQRADYCFTVAVVYSADDVATAGPVCTSRG